MFTRRTRQPPDVVPSQGPRRLRSLALEVANRALVNDGRKVEILDLGAACGETLAFYTGLPCKLHFVDCYADLKATPRGDEESAAEAMSEACAKALPFDASTRFDLILTWDLFNYLSREEIGVLAGHLRRFSRETAPLVSLIWTTQRIPANPNRYAIIDRETLEYRPTTTRERPGPRYREPDLLRVMRGYRAGRSFLLRHGMQEYIFEPLSGADLTGRPGWAR